MKKSIEILPTARRLEIAETLEKEGGIMAADAEDLFAALNAAEAENKKLQPRTDTTENVSANELMETLISQMRDNKAYQENVIRAIYDYFIERPGIASHSFVLKAAKIYGWPEPKPL